MSNILYRAFENGWEQGAAIPIFVPSFEGTQSGTATTIEAATQQGALFDHTYTIFTPASSTVILSFGFTSVISFIGTKTYYFSPTKKIIVTMSGTSRITFEFYTNDSLTSTLSANIPARTFPGLPDSNNKASYMALSSISTRQFVYVCAHDSINATWWEDITPFIPTTDPYADIDGESDITGPGTGTVAVPGYPGLTATSTGIVGLFAPSAAQMQSLASYMWTDFGGQGTDVVSVLKEVVEAIKRAISNPLDYVIGLNIIPSQGLSIGAPQTIRFGFTNTNVSMPALTNQYFTVDCGSLDFDPICGDTFIDYAPYSKFSIYLPYIGVKDVDANDFVGHTISVIYHGDTVTGGVTAYILKDGSVMYQYSGCCALNVPLSSDNWGNTISGAVQIATAVVSAAATGGTAGALKAAALGASSVAANPSLLSPQVAHSGAVSGGAGCMAVQYPFVIREAVRFHSTDGFNSVSGYPSFYYKQLSEMSGYTKVLDVHLHNMTATQDEISEIENILKEGAIF